MPNIRKILAHLRALLAATLATVLDAISAEVHRPDSQIPA